MYIGADFVPTDINRILFESGDIESLVGSELYHMLEQADLNVFNLEVPLTDFDSPIDKFGNNLKSPTKTINAYTKLQPLLLGLGNNHCYDHGFEGLTTTMDLLNANSISHCGAGVNIEEAKQPFVFEKDGIRIGFYMCTENEFSSASSHSAGANPFDPLESFDDVHRLKDTCHHVIVLYHGGKEFYPYPSPNLQKVCRKFVDKGASLVVCQHSHCIGTREDYNEGAIIYGQGNFLFHSNFFEHYQDIVNDSLLIEVNVTKTSLIAREIPIMKTTVGILLSPPERAEEVLSKYKKDSQYITDPDFILNQYKSFADNHINRYLREFLGRSWPIKLLNGLCGRRLARLLLGKISYLGIQNFIECEAHRELFLCGLKNINRK